MSVLAGSPKAMRAIVGIASLALCLAGVIRLGEGAAVPMKAEIAQRRLERAFEHRFEIASMASAIAPETTRVFSSTPVSAVRHPVAALPIEGPIARISVHRLSISEVVLAGDGTHDQLAEGPIMIKRGDQASPVTILAAHRDTHFLFIRDLREGDEVTMQFVNGSVERYRVSRFETVRWDRFTYPLDPARPLLALTTCFPFGGTEYGGPWRRVVWAERIGHPQAFSPEDRRHQHTTRLPL